MIHLILLISYILVIIAGMFILWQTEIPDKVPLAEPENTPTVSIIIPTRNEERNIAHCLDSLLELDYPDYEIIVVDGNSEDNTVQIVNSYDKVKLIIEPERPEGWVGKPWGCYTGYTKACGDVLLFTDADTFHSPKSLNTTISYLEESKGFVSLFTTQKFKTFWEHLLTIVFLVISVSVRGVKGTGDSHIANGQYMLFTRDSYEKLGTHQVVAGSIIEDLEFGSIAAENNLAPKIINHKNLVKVRMYNSISEIKEGFSKNLALGVNRVGIESLLLNSVIMLWAMAPFLLIPYALIFNSDYSIAIIFSGSFGVFLFIVLLYFIENEISERGTWYVVLYPVYMVGFMILVSISVYKTVFSKTINWKGRSYKVN